MLIRLDSPKKNYKGKCVLSDVICNTSPIQYLYQLGLLHVLPSLAQHIFVPPAVVDEIELGRASGVSLPQLELLEWVEVRRPVGEVVLPLVTDLGPGEAEVLMLALELPEAVVVLDDMLARRVVEMLRLHPDWYAGTSSRC